MAEKWGEFCREIEEPQVLKLAEEMVTENVDFKYFQNYFFNEQSSLVQGKNQEGIRTFTKSNLYKKLRDLGDVLGFKQGYVRPARKKSH